MDREHLDVRAGYDRWAEVYDTDLNPLVLLEEPLVREWVGDPAGLRVADVGCGTGRHTAWLAAAGAEVDAFDASPGMMSRARARVVGRPVRFIEHALPAALPVEDARYDLALLALVADHVEDLGAAFHELRRVLRPGGRLIFTVLHPAMYLKGVSARFTDPRSGERVYVKAVDHPYGAYVTAPLRAGLQIEEIAERSIDEALAVRAPRAEKYLGWPLLLAMRLRRG
jgi:malonyl-CoA O-methyltransferase